MGYYEGWRSDQPSNKLNHPNDKHTTDENEDCVRQFGLEGWNDAICSRTWSGAQKDGVAMGHICESRINPEEKLDEVTTLDPRTTTAEPTTISFTSQVWTTTPTTTTTTEVDPSLELSTDFTTDFAPTLTSNADAPDDASDDVTTVANDVTTVADDVTTVAEDVTTVADVITSLADDITNGPYEITTVANDAITVSDDVTAIFDVVTTLSDELTTLAEDVDTVNDDVIITTLAIITSPDDVTVPNDDVTVEATKIPTELDTPDFSLPLKKVEMVGEVETKLEWDDQLLETDSDFYLETRDLVEENLIDVFESNYLIDEMNVLELTFSQKIEPSRKRKSVRSRRETEGVTMVEYVANIVMNEQSTLEDVLSALEVQSALESSQNDIFDFSTFSLQEVVQDSEEVFTIFGSGNPSRRL